MESSQIVVSMKEQLKGLSVVCAQADVAANCLAENLQKFGPVNRRHFDSFRDAVQYLLPVKSFTTRFLVLGLNGWSAIITDMKGEICYVDAYAISRKCGVKAISIFFGEGRREFHVFESGEKLRQVQSLLDGDSWYFREEGAVQWFEDTTEYNRTRKQDRLSVAAVLKYFRSYTGFDVPEWKHVQFTNLIGLERSIKDLRVPPIHFNTQLDI